MGLKGERQSTRCILNREWEKSAKQYGLLAGASTGVGAHAPLLMETDFGADACPRKHADYRDFRTMLSC